MHHPRRQMRQGKDRDTLSSLAKGTGLFDGGVEIECHQDYNLSLSGKAFLKPSSAPLGQSAKPYKPHVLSLPKTYVTRRGQMVLFTSPEDMIIGSTCQVHRRVVQKTISQYAANHLKTTDNLVSSALNYEPEKDSGISEGEGDCSSPQPGHFTNVYLDRLQQKTAVMTTRNDLIEEDIEAPSISPQVIPALDSEPENDSGLEDSYPPVPQVTAVIIPDGRWNDTNEKDGKEIPQCDTNEVMKNASSNELTKIMFELNQKPQHMTSRKKVFDTGGRGRKKGQKSVVVSKSSTSTESKVKQEEQYSNSGISRKTKIAAKKRNKKQKKSTCIGKAVEKKISISAEDDLHQSTEMSAMELAEQLETTTPDVDDLIEHPEPVIDLRQKRKMLQLARAEERRKEIEKKRSELREMEVRRQNEEIRKQQLLENLAQEAKRQVEKAAEKENDSFSVAAIEDNEHRRLAEEEEEEARRLNERSTLLKNREDEVEQELISAEKEAQEAILKAKQMRQRVRAEEEKRKRIEKQMEQEQLLKLKKEEEEQQHQRREEEKEGWRKRAEEKLRLLAIEDACKLDGKEEMNYKMRLELQAQKHYQQMTSHLFSYFHYVPPAVSSNAKTKRRKTAVRVKNN